MAEGMFLFYVSFFLIFESCFATNAAWKKSITAEHSCGVNKTELYYNITQSSVLPFQREISICDQSDPAYARPPEAMVDGSLFTFWQSEASRDDARITIELSGPYQKVKFVQMFSVRSLFSKSPSDYFLDVGGNCVVSNQLWLPFLQFLP